MMTVRCCCGGCCGAWVDAHRLDTLTQLTDLSLFNNAVKTIENLDSLKQLNVLSLGNNALTNLENVMYLRRFKHLRLVNLAGNPLCQDSEYRSYVLSHLNKLKYLDYRLVDEPSVHAAREQYQDEMLELEEVEKAEENKEMAEMEKATERERLRKANLGGVDTLFADMLREDPEFAKLRSIPTLTEAIGEFQDKFSTHTEVRMNV